jgi:hypothetical protein
MPAHLLRLDAIDIFLRDDGRLSLGTCGRGWLFRHDRRDGSCLRSRGKRGGARHQSDSEFEKFPAFHGLDLLVEVSVWISVSPLQHECWLNSPFIFVSMFDG